MPLVKKIYHFSPSLSPAIERVDERSDVGVSQRSASITANASVNLMALRGLPAALKDLP